jgi:uncharacterized protein
MRIAYALLLVCWLSPVAGAIADERPTPSIVITGEGSVRAVPDEASITLGVFTEAASAAAALTANSSAVRDLIAAVKEAGIAADDIATSSVTLEPRIVYPSDGRGTPKIEGYAARNSLSIRVRELARLGPLLDAAVAKGSNDIGALSFGHSNREALTDKARAVAVADARRRASVVAEAAGVKLGRVLSITEGGEIGFPPQSRMVAMQAKADVPIEAGAREIGARVTVAWEIVN